jgi:SAM-dependent MidA family methyltransferase
MAGAVHWLDCPGESDLTAHVNLTAVGNAARAAGLTPLGEVDQTYFLTALGLADRLDDGSGMASIRTRLGAGTLIAPGGLGSTMKVIAFGKEVGAPALQGFSVGRLT